jgi:hypothetical protein
MTFCVRLLLLVARVPIAAFAQAPATPDTQLT